MRRVLAVAAAYPAFTLLLLIALTLVCATMLPRLQIQIAAQSMQMDSDPLWQDYQQLQQAFGSDQLVVILVEDSELFSPDRLQRLKQLRDELEALDFVSASQSLFNVPWVRETGDEIASDPYLAEIPTNPEEARSIQQAASNNPIIRQQLISADGKSLALNLQIRESQDRDFDQASSAAIEAILQNYQADFDGLMQIGPSYIRSLISDRIRADQVQILPLALGILLLILGLSLRNLNAMLLPALTAIMSIIMTLALMVALNIPISVMTSIIPALLLIIGSTEDIHLLSEYQAGLAQGMERPSALGKVIENQHLAVLLAFSTTLAGFLSITVNDLSLLREFGLVAALGLLINFGVTSLWVPAWLKLFGSKRAKAAKHSGFYERFASAIFRLVLRFRRTAFVLLLLILLGFAAGIPKLHVNNDTLDFFPQDADVRQRANHLHERLSGMQNFSIVFDSGIEGTFKKVKYLEEIRQVQDYLAQREVFDSSLSFADFMMLIHQVMDGSSKPQMPYDDTLIDEYLALVQSQAFFSYVSKDFSLSRILVRHNISSSHQLQQELDELQQFIDDNLQSRVQIRFNGSSILSNHAADSMASGQVQSLLVMVVVIYLLVTVLFVDFRAGVLALIPNLFPVLILFGLMGHLNIPLDTGTTMVAVIALGICVDDTIHFLSRYHHFTRGTQDVDAALFKTIAHEATPIITTSLALAAGFATLAASGFKPIFYFGVLGALVMILALFSTFIILPLLLSYTRLITIWDMLALNFQLKLLKNSLIFRDMRGYQIKKAILSGRVMELHANQIVVDQGQTGKEMYVVLDGTARVSRKDELGAISTLGQLGPGDLFGETALLSDCERTARVTANDELKLLVIKWSGILQLSRHHAAIAMKLFRNISMILSQRLASQNRIQSFRDESTGAITRPYLYELLQIEIERSRRFDEPLSMIIMDIYYQKHDAHAYVDDERIEKAVINVLNNQTRIIDVFARIHSCRFMILLPRTQEDRAHMITARMRKSIEHTDFPEIVRLHINALVQQCDHTQTAEQQVQEMETRLQQSASANKSLTVG